MRSIPGYDGGHVGYMRGVLHPNGSTYILIPYTKVKPERLDVIRYDPGTDTFSAPLKTYRVGFEVPSWFAICDLVPQPNGDLLMLLPLVQGGGSIVAGKYDRIPRALPPFNPAVPTQSYVCSATDTIAREWAVGATETAQRVEQEARALRGQYREDGKKNEETLNKRAAETNAEMHKALRKGFDSLSGIYLTRGEAWEKMIMDRVFADLSNPNAPLPNVITQKAVAAARAENKVLRDELAALKKALKDQGIKV